MENDRILETIVADHKGKPIFFDFWTTWCGVCLEAIEEMKSIKQKIIDKGVEIIYITEDSSPKATWAEMLPDIGGKHYYLPQEAVKALGKKYDILELGEGYPYYLIFDKKGNISFRHAGFTGNEKMLQELEKVW